MTTIKRFTRISVEPYQPAQPRQTSNQLQGPTNPASLSNSQLAPQDQSKLKKVHYFQADQAPQLVFNQLNRSTEEATQINPTALNRERLLKAIDEAPETLSAEQSEKLIHQASSIIQNIRSNYPA